MSSATLELLCEKDVIIYEMGRFHTSYILNVALVMLSQLSLKMWIILNE